MHKVPKVAVKGLLTIAAAANTGTWWHDFMLISKLLAWILALFLLRLAYRSFWDVSCSVSCHLEFVFLVFLVVVHSSPHCSAPTPVTVTTCLSSVITCLDAHAPGSLPLIKSSSTTHLLCPVYGFIFFICLFIKVPDFYPALAPCLVTVSASKSNYNNSLFSERFSKLRLFKHVNPSSKDLKYCIKPAYFKTVSKTDMVYCFINIHNQKVSDDAWLKIKGQVF